MPEQIRRWARRVIARYAPVFDNMARHASGDGAMGSVNAHVEAQIRYARRLATEVSAADTATVTAPKGRD